MKKTVFLTIVLFMLSAAAAFACECNTCTSWECLDACEKVFFTTARYGNQENPAQTWELAIWERTDTGEEIRAQDDYEFPNGSRVPFSLTYDAETGQLTYVLGNKTLVYTFDDPLFDTILIFAKGNQNGNDVWLDRIYINGDDQCDLRTNGGYVGLKKLVNPRQDFVITGKVALYWDEEPLNEVPGFHIMLMDCEILTAVTLASFEASAGSGQVKLEWETSDETDNLGFNVYRAAEAEGFYEQVNESLILSKVGTGIGTTYDFTDRGVQNRENYFYMLEDVDIFGVKTRHGPVEATPLLLYSIFK